MLTLAISDERYLFLLQEDRFSEAAKRLEEEKKRLVAFTAASSASGANSGGAIAGPGLPPPMSMGGLTGIPNSLPTLNSAMLAPPAAASQPNPNLGPSNQPVQAAQAQLLSGLLSSFQGTLSGNPNIAAAAQLLQQQLGAVAGAGPPHSAYGAPHPAQPHTGGYPPQQQQQPAPYGAYGAQQPMYPAQGQAAPGPSYPGSTGPPGAGSGAPMHSGYQQQQQYNRPDSDPQRSSSPGNARTLDALVGRMTAGACSSYIGMKRFVYYSVKACVCLFIMRPLSKTHHYRLDRFPPAKCICEYAVVTMQPVTLLAARYIDSGQTTAEAFLFPFGMLMTVEFVRFTRNLARLFIFWCALCLAGWFRNALFRSAVSFRSSIDGRPFCRPRFVP